MTKAARLASSFRDPSGFVFRAEGTLYRQVNRFYAEDWEKLNGSGLLADLVSRHILVPHETAAISLALSDSAIAVLRPEPIPFVSYPYEWSFSQLQDAALTTLEVQMAALERGMILKDATAYNVQFLRGKPTFIDTLSFTSYHEGEPWIAYGQFCRHFLAPLALMALVDVRLGALQRVHLDGIPLDLAAKLLPGFTKLRPGLLAHLHVHARAQRADSRDNVDARAKGAHVSRTAMLALIDSLASTVQSLHREPSATEWAGYYADTNYTEAAMQDKHRLVAEFIDAADPASRVCWDLGANTGEFSRIAANRGFYTISMDGDTAAVEKAYLAIREAQAPNILPLLIDLSNPSPAQGWAGSERDSILARGRAGLVLSLALIHHLAIANNVPLAVLAEFFSRVGEFVICEFVPKQDSQVARLLRSRQDIFGDYDAVAFEAAMSLFFEIVRAEAIMDSDRKLYLMRKR
ncbi:MAG: class I SAM-dependent methyltransferase [Fimbriimonadaceae bacterium]